MPGTEALRNLICRTHKLIVIVNINHTAHTHTHNIYPWLGPVKSGVGGGGGGGGGGQSPHLTCHL